MFAGLTIVGFLGKDAEQKGEWVVMSVGFKPSTKSTTIWATVRTKMRWCAALEKKTRVMIYGTPDFKVWNSNEGAKVDVTIFANSVVNLTPRAENEGERTPNVPAPEYAPVVDDDVPF